jgi:endonuclease/exonuclease/phosphatase family metal-dependent hydrolase
VKLAVPVCAIALAVAGCGGSPGTPYTLMQMNLCLSGLASCYGKVAYPAGVNDAEARIGEERPDAVTLNETCRGDVALIARRTGYRFRFSRVVYRGKLLPCVRPGGRGLFGDAVLTRAPIESSESRPFVAQAGIERRGWLCVDTPGIDVCTAHLAARSPVEAPANDAQCAELATLLARRARPVAFGGDVNRRGSCAPEGFWRRTDGSAHQSAGLQQAYGSGALRSPSAGVVPASHTDHDFLRVRMRLRRDARHGGPLPNAGGGGRRVARPGAA